MADGEERTHLPVFVDDALAIEQSETMTARIGAIEDMRQSCFVHSLARIGDGNLNVTILGSSHLAILGSCHLGLIHHLGANHHLSAAWCKLAGIIGDGIDHEERKGAVGLHHGICRAHLQVYTPHLETHLSFRHNVEERLQREALDAEADGTLAHLNPIGEHAVVLVNLVGQLRNILVSFLSDCFRFTALFQSIHLVNHAVDKRRDAVHQRNLGALLHVSSSIFRDVELNHVAGFVYFFKSFG